MSAGRQLALVDGAVDLFAAAQVSAVGLLRVAAFHCKPEAHSLSVQLTDQ